MCGIFGWVAPRPLTEPDLQRARRAVSTLVHRGPDQQGEWHQDRVYMGHRRLSIIDLSIAAKQPFTDRSGRFVLAFNGEIYNYIELRVELEREGARFTTTSDTEVMLAAFAHWGDRALRRFDGMFAGALHDRATGRHLLFRDPLGQKPLYYHRFEGGVVYASELRALLELDHIRWKLDRAAFPRYLMNGYYAWDETPIDGIRKLLPGCQMEVTRTGVRLYCYWDSRPGEDELDLTDAEAAGEFERLFAVSCARSMRSDVSFGVFLSGGLDSSLVLAFCRKARADVRSFSVAMSEPDFDESVKARLVNACLGVTDHHRFSMDRESVETAMKGVFATGDEPHGDPGFVNAYFLAQASRPYLTVALAGDGGDELFAGYLPFAGLAAAPWLEAAPAPLLNLAKMATNLLPSTDRYMGLRAQLTAYLQGFPARQDVRFPLWLASISLEELVRLCPSAGDHGHNEAAAGLYGFVEHLMEPVSHRTPVQQLLYFYQKVFLPEFVCMHTDRAAMQFGLEVRSPFLSSPMVEFANRLPDRMKVRGRRMKWMLRQVAARQGLPEAVTGQRKQGFTFPLARWLKTVLKPRMEELLMPEVWREDDLVDTALVSRYRDDHLAGARNNYRLLYNLMAFRAWRQVYPAVDSGSGGR